MASATDLNKGSTFEHKGELLKVVRKEVVAVGTHSHTKLKFFVKPLFGGGGEKILNFAHNDKVDIVEIQKKSGSVVSKMPEKAQIMDNRSYETLDVEVEPELLEQLNEGDNVIFVEYKGKIIIVEKL